MVSGFAVYCFGFFIPAGFAFYATLRLYAAFSGLSLIKVVVSTGLAEGRFSRV